MTMRKQTEQERQAAAATLKEVMSKLEEALRLSRQVEEHEQQRRERAGAGTHELDRSASSSPRPASTDTIAERKSLHAHFVMPAWK